MDQSWALGNAEFLQQLGTIMWTKQDEKAPQFVEDLAMFRVGYELYNRMSGEREVEMLRNQTILAIAKFIKDHPKATKEELTKEIAKHIIVFKKKIEEM